MNSNLLQIAKYYSSSLFLVILLSACDKAAEQKPQNYPYNVVGMTMGTSYNIKASRLPDLLTPNEITAQVNDLLDKINGQMSTYQKDSELSLLNQNASTDWIPVSPGLHEVLKEANKISKLSNGVFDVTVGPLVNLWGFGPKK